MRAFLRSVDPEACSFWVITIRSCGVVLIFICYIYQTSYIIQEKEQDLIKAYQRNDMSKALSLIRSGVSVKCRDTVYMLVQTFILITL